MPSDKHDFEAAQQIHELLIDVANQGSKEEALECNAMDQLLTMTTTEQIPHGLGEFLFRCAIAVQFGPVRSIISEGLRAADKGTWGEDTLSQYAKETAKRIDALAEAYNRHHDESEPVFLPPDDDDPNQGMK